MLVSPGKARGSALDNEVSFLIFCTVAYAISHLPVEKFTLITKICLPFVPCLSLLLLSLRFYIPTTLSGVSSFAMDLKWPGCQYPAVAVLT